MQKGAIGLYHRSGSRQDFCAALKVMQLSLAGELPIELRQRVETVP